MEIEPREVTVRELVEGYKDHGDNGVVGYGGKLDIRPKFQREFVYNDKQRNAVIDTVQKGYPLNVMYWADRGNNEYEIIDGQQRTVSISQYVDGTFSVDGLFFHNLPENKQQAILGYPLSIYVCSGTPSEKLEWFKTINIAGETLTDQELRNAVYCGSWVSDAKIWFSKAGCPAQKTGEPYLRGSAIRQEYLETAIKWTGCESVEDYMGRNQHEKDAKKLWEHFRAVIDWVERTFTEYRKPMKGVDWGSLYLTHRDDGLDPEKLEKRTAKLIEDDEVTKHSGIYAYLLSGDEKSLSLRAFKEATRRRVYEKQKKKCALCKKAIEFDKAHGDHITAWAEGGKTTEDNCQILCRDCNLKKGAS